MRKNTNSNSNSLKMLWHKDLKSLMAVTTVAHWIKAITSFDNLTHLTFKQTLFDKDS